MAREPLVGIAAFAAVAERRSFTAAASQLGVSPSAVSHAVRELEKRLGIRLLNRSTRQVGLTEAGERYLSRVGPALGELAAAAEGLHELRDRPSGLLRLDLSRIAYYGVLSPRLASFRQAYPDVQLELILSDSLSDIVANGCDAGIRLGEMLEPDMFAVPVGGEMQSVIVAAPAYLEGRRRPREPGDLAEHACIGFRFPTSGKLYRWEFERDGREIELTPPATLVANDPLVQLDMVRNGLGIGYVISDMADDDPVAMDLAAGRLIRLLEDWSPRFPGHFLYHRNRRHAPAKLRALIAHLRR